MNTTTYASKAAAKKGAARKGLTFGSLTFTQDENGRWSGTPTVSDTPTDIATPTINTAHKAAVKKAVTKAAIVRGDIASAKAAGIEQAEVVARISKKLEMAPALARAYVKNNWNKV
jgi:hypothetical protein